MRKTLLALAFLIISIVLVRADSKKIITFEQLPQQAQEFVNTHFGEQKIALANREREVFDIDYQLIFTDGNKIDFDKKGLWTDIDCRHGEVPRAIVPEPIQQMVDNQYSTAKITKIERDSFKYEIELSNGLDLEFDNKFRLKDID